MGEGDESVVDRAGLQVDEAGFQRPVLLDRALAREAPADIVVRAEDGRDAGEHLRFVTLDPSEPGGDELLIDAVASLGEKGGFVDLGAKLVDFGAAAPVALLNARAQQPPGKVQKHHRRQHAGHADCGDVGGRGAA